MVIWTVFPSKEKLINSSTLNRFSLKGWKCLQKLFENSYQAINLKCLVLNLPLNKWIKRALNSSVFGVYCFRVLFDRYCHHSWWANCWRKPVSAKWRWAAGQLGIIGVILFRKKKSRVGCVSSEVYAGISLYLRDKLFLPLLFQENTTKNERHLLLWSKIEIPIILAVVNC
jgi:hypothetical protein